MAHYTKYRVSYAGQFSYGFADSWFSAWCPEFNLMYGKSFIFQSAFFMLPQLKLDINPVHTLHTTDMTTV